MSPRAKSPGKNDEFARAERAAKFVLSKTKLRPRIALVLGSGLGAFADEFSEAARIDYKKIPHFPVSTAIGHAGRLVIGKVDGVPVAGMQGRVHFYEGYPMKDVVFPMRVLGRMGIRAVILTNAAGGINTGYRQGSLVALSDHINLTGTNAALGPNEPRFADMPPARIVPMLADEGVYLASESTFARVLREHGQTTHRGRAKAPRSGRPPTTHIAGAAREVWCWDMTYLPAEVAGQWFYLYLILDLYSRKIVGWEVHERDDASHAAHLVRRTALAEGIASLADKPVLHGDNGSTLKATTVLAMLHWLGVKPSYSRPRVSDDNAYAEALFRTAKYRPEFPTTGFADLNAARDWASDFVHWYNFDHRHSSIRYVSPAQRHDGDDHVILAARHEVYVQARERNPARWSGCTRDWTPIGAVTLNPERESVVTMASHATHKQPLAA